MSEHRRFIAELWNLKEPKKIDAKVKEIFEGFQPLPPGTQETVRVFSESINNTDFLGFKMRIGQAQYLTEAEVIPNLNGTYSYILDATIDLGGVNWNSSIAMFIGRPEIIVRTATSDMKLEIGEVGESCVCKWDTWWPLEKGNDGRTFTTKLPGYRQMDGDKIRMKLVATTDKIATILPVEVMIFSTVYMARRILGEALSMILCGIKYEKSDKAGMIIKKYHRKTAYLEVPWTPGIPMISNPILLRFMTPQSADPTFGLTENEELKYYDESFAESHRLGEDTVFLNNNDLYPDMDPRFVRREGRRILQIMKNLKYSDFNKDKDDVIELRPGVRVSKTEIMEYHPEKEEPIIRRARERRETPEDNGVQFHYVVIRRRELPILVKDIKKRLKKMGVHPTVLDIILQPYEDEDQYQLFRWKGIIAGALRRLDIRRMVLVKSPFPDLQDKCDYLLVEKNYDTFVKAYEKYEYDNEDVRTF